jgi:hypothetical protein
MITAVRTASWRNGLTGKAKIKIIVDILMTVALLLLMAYSLVEDKICIF